MAAIRIKPGINLRRTFGAVAIFLVLGILWLAFFESAGPSSPGGQDFLNPSNRPLASTGAGFQPLETALLVSVSTASVAKAGTVPGSRDDVTVLALSGAAALVFSIMVFFSTFRLRFGSSSLGRVHLRQITGA